MIPRVSYDTVQITGRDGYYPSRVMVSAGAGTVWENPTRSIPVRNLKIEVEHGFGIVANTWPFLNAGWKMRLYSSPVGRCYRVGVLLTNCINCLWPNQVL